MIESTWKDEARSLLETVSTLEEDNQKLTSLLTENLQVIPGLFKIGIVDIKSI